MGEEVAGGKILGLRVVIIDYSVTGGDVDK